MRDCHYYVSHNGYELGNIRAGDLASGDLPLMVNCMGNVVKSDPFVTHCIRGRSDYYLFYVEHGSMELVLDDGIRLVRAGDAVLFPPHYSYHYAYKGGETLSYLWVHFTGSYVQRLLSDCGLAPQPFVGATTSTPALPVGFRSMFEIFERGGALQCQELACALEQLVLCLAKNTVWEARGRRLDRALNYIHTAYATDLRVPQLAEMESLSNSRFITLFRQQTGVSPNEYIIKLRISIACDQLRNTRQSIKEIACSVGYPDPYFFSKLFKKKTGVSPQHYRDGE